MLLQVMPAQDAQLNTPSIWRLTETIKAEELFTLPATDVLWRLYHEEEGDGIRPARRRVQMHLFSPALRRCAKTLPDEEVDSILADEGEIDMHCDYCGNHYLFNAMDIAEIRNNASPADPQVHHNRPSRRALPGFLVRRAWRQLFRPRVESITERVT